KNQILVSNQSNLNQFFRMVNSITQEMYDVCISVTNSEECINYSYYSNYYSKKAPYQTLVVKEMLNKFQKEKYYDIFAYFPTEDRIISGTNASLTSDYYYDTYYSGTVTEFRQEFYDILECEAKCPTFFVMNRGSADSYLCVAMKQPNYKEPELSYVAVVVLEKGFINQLIEEGGDTGGIIMMFDENGEILLSNGSDSTAWHLEGDSGTDAFYEVEVDQKTYMMMVMEADVVDGYYASAISLDYFWKQLYRMRIICGSGIAICVAVSILIAYKNTLRTYRPVKDVVTRLQEQAENDYNEREHTEFEFITALFEKQKEERRTLKRKLNNTEKLRRERTLMALMNGSVDGKEAEEDSLLKNGIELCSDYFMVGIVWIETKDEMELLSFIFRNVIEELCNREHKGYVVTGDEPRYIILMNPREMDDEEKMKEILLEGEAFLKQHYHMNMIIALSDIHEGIEEIPMAYKEAEKAISYQYLLEDRLIIEYRQIENRKLHYPASSESRLSRMLNKYVKEQENRKTPDIFVAELMRLYEIDENASMETVECFKYEIANTVNRAMISAGYSAEEGGRASNELLARPAMRQFRDELVRLLALLCQKEREKEQQNDVCRFAKQYIEEHFSDPELSVVGVGEQVKLSSAYLSRMFKERYGVSILTYIAETRINNAKKTLRETEKSVQEIAEESGFLSSNVFIKSFKKLEGITPGAYRELLEETKQL
ncbi:MAG: helix-turn-helix domain-containing protein, partial [Roseburia sp.]|nr:helix-turn-helix domain-containing protein [Roseburia sp.]